MINVQVKERTDQQLHQGDIYRDIEYIEYADIINGQVNISKLHYQYVVLLSQECDLTQDWSERRKKCEFGSSEDENGDKQITNLNYDKILQSIIVAPMFNYEHFKLGSHFSNLGFDMSKSYEQFINPKRTPRKVLEANNNPRFHYFEFDQTVPIVPSVVDFKHFFTISINWLYENKNEHYVCSLDELYRERLSQRFSNFLSRIGLPNEM